MFDFPELYFPLGDWVNVVIEWLTENLAPFFNVITVVIREPLIWLKNSVLLWLPWWAIIIIFVGVAWKFAGRKVALLAALGLLFIGALGGWDDTMTTLALMITAVGLSVVIGVPLGIISAKSDRFESILRPFLDTMQTMPAFVYLIPAVFFFKLGMVPAVVATLIYAIPPCIRLTNLGIRQVAADVVEAGKAFGATSWQLLFKIQFPLALPNIMAGVNQTIMMALAMVVLASMIGAEGLGLEVLRGLERLDVGRGFEAGISIVLVAIILDRITQSLAKARGAEQRLSK
jgi:glycine betaine/proline transport system permease protein